MAEHRTSIKIIGDILHTARDEMQDEHGVSVTYLVRRANIPHNRISNILHNLTSQGLLEQTDSRGAARYKISSTGRDFLRAYQEFSRFAEDYGLQI